MKSQLTYVERLLLLLTSVCLLLTLIHAAAFPRFITSDVGLFLEVGNKLLDGERPYVDYEENNFPMIHVLNVIPAGLGRITGLPPTVWIQVCTIILLIGSLALTWRLLTRYAGAGVATVGVFSLALTSFDLMILTDWAQREHLFVLMFMPWLILRVMRREGHSLGRGESLLIGLLAGIGLAIKPYFVIVGLLPEVVGVLTTRRWKIITPEVLGVVVVAALHALYFALNPDVLNAFVLLLQRLSLSYNSYSEIDLAALVPLILFHIVLTLFPVVLVALGLRFQTVPHGMLWAVGAMSMGGCVAYIMQHKGWAYQGIPFLIPDVMLVVFLVREGIARRLKRKSALMPTIFRVISVGTIAALIAVQVFSVMTIGRATPTSTLYDDVEAYSADGDWVMFLDSAPIAIYPMLPALNRRSASRYLYTQPFVMAYYQYEGLPYTDPAHVVPEYAQEMLDSIGADIARHHPELIIIRSGYCVPCSQDFPDLYDYLLVRGVIDAVILPEYHLLMVDRHYYIYQRNQP